MVGSETLLRALAAVLCLAVLAAIVVLDVVLVDPRLERAPIAAGAIYFGVLALDCYLHDDGSRWVDGT